ncbi:unnamed protein product [[Candida] boidinii]|nr:unnamed protein product [[Candida] boidinii]
MESLQMLKVSKIFGASSGSSSEFAAVDDLIAYSASGGVVVCNIKEGSLEIERQRFFCANSLSSKSELFSDKLDEYDFPVDSEIEIVSRQGSTSPSKESFGDSFGSSATSLPSSSSSMSSVSHSVHDVNRPIRPVSMKKMDGFSPLSSMSKRIRSINCIALSPDKKLLAVGEIGYQPRILIYSLAPGSNFKPISIIQEHLFGINSLCFSPDSKKLCSLGLVNDGFIIIWKLYQNGKFYIQFDASNKCTSIVNKLIWHNDFIIAGGLRNIKIWKENQKSVTRSPGSSSLLKGRNAWLI